MTYGSSWREHYLKIPVDFRFGFNIGRAVRIFAGVGPKLHIGLASHLRSARAKNMDSNVAHNQQFNIGVAYVF